MVGGYFISLKKIYQYIQITWSKSCLFTVTKHIIYIYRKLIFGYIFLGPHASTTKPCDYPLN